MNILFVTGEFAYNKRDMALGGMANAVYKSALGMKRRGHRVRILSVSNNSKQWLYHGLEVISIKTYKYADNDGVISTLIGTLKREYCIEAAIKQLNKKESIDIIQYAGWFGIGLFHINNIPAIMRVSSYTKIQFEHNYSYTKRYLLMILEKFAAKRMNYIFAPSRIMAAGVEKDVQRQVGIIETPFLCEDIIWNDDILRKHLNGKKYIFYFGRMSVDKGILTVRDIICKVLDAHKDIFFVFAGSGPKYNGISIKNELLRTSKKYKDRILFLGWLPKNKLLPVINNAEMILMPSLSDNFPNSCAEAMALGKIVIGTDGSSLEQFIVNGKNGFLSEIGNPCSLYQYVEQVLVLSEKEKKRISEKAVMKIKTLDLDIYSKRLEKLYKSVIKVESIKKINFCKLWN